MSEQHLNPTPIGPRHNEIAPPPRVLFWLVIGLFLLMLAAAGIGIGGIYIFREVLVPGQQQRVIEHLPFMRSLLRPTPVGGILPTAIPGGGDISPEDLLAAPLFGATNTPEPEITATPTDAPTEAAALMMPSPTPMLTATPIPTLTLTPTLIPATATSAPAVDANPALVADARPARPASHRNFGFTHVRQTWNNCGPANITMALSYFGWRQDQSFAASFVKPDREDKNVSPHELVSFVNEQTQVKAITRIGGDLETLRGLIAAGFPVIIETGYMPEGYDWIGHYQTIVGYDDALRVFYIYDSYLGAGENGAGITESYDTVDNFWQHFNRTFIVVYEPAREAQVAEILGALADPETSSRIALEVAREEARANPNNAFAWFNMGTALGRLGQHEEAARHYDQALRQGLPFRMTWYQFGPFEAYFYANRYDDVLALVNANLTNGAQYVEETHYWQGRVFAARGDRAAAEGAFRRALQRNPRYTAAREALDQLTS